VVGAADAAQLPAICATAATGRAHFEYRAAVIADEPTAAAAALAGVATGTSSPGTWQTRVPSDGRIVLMYPGQGSAYTGMLRGLWLRDPVFREAFDLCASALAPGLDVPLAEVMFGADADRLLAQTAYAQPAIWAAQTALTRWFAHVGVAPAAVVGHSVGEVAAWTAAGMLSVDDAARFVAARGRAMQSQPSGVMLAVMGPVAAVTALAARHEGATVASVNGPSQVVVAGPAATIAAVERAAGRDGWGTRRVRGDRAFHSSLMDDALPAIASAARSLRVHPATCAVASTLTGRLADASLTTADYWTRQARQPVQFAAAISTLWASGCRVFVEVGPSATLSALAQTCVDEPDTGSWIAGLRRDADEEATVRGSVAQIYAAGGSIDWRAWDRARRARVVLPTYPFERRRFWVDGSPAAQSERTLTYRVVWTPVEPAADAMRPGTWVVVEPANLLADALRPSGADVRSVAVTADADATVAAAAATPHGLAGVVYAGALDQPNEASVARLPEIIADACLAVVPWVKALDRLRIESPGTAARLWIVTRGAVAVTSDDRHIRLTQSPFWGFGKVVGLEHPDVWGGLLDLDPAGDAAAGLRPWLAAGPIVQHEDQIAVRHGRLWTPRLEAASSPHERVALREGATYLITGGMGGLGLRVAEWMVDRGAKQIVLVGRRAAAGAATIRIDALRDRGASIDVMQADVADATAVAQVIDRIDREMPPLRGIVHAAGVNGTSAVDALDRASFETVLSAKTAGAWVLHEAIRSRPLDFFVLFSSIASVWGSKDQAHYAAANAFLDQLAELRTRSGLAALSIAWGPWSAGGMATAAARDWLDRVGVRTMAADTGLDVLVRLLSTSGQRVAADVDWDRFLEIYTARRVRPFFDRVRPSPPSGLTVPASLPAETRLAAEIIARGPIAGRRDLLRFVTGEVTAVLNLEASNPPAPHQGFFSIGFDSLMALELKNRISRALAVVVPATLAFDYPNIHDLSEYLARDVLHLDAAALADRASSIAVAAAPDRPGTTELDATVAQALRRLERVLGTN
jgi:acyl transferase domain-containing protein/acyl carrier protein